MDQKKRRESKIPRRWTNLFTAIILTTISLLVGHFFSLSLSWKSIESVRFSFSSLPVLLGGIWLGPWWGGFIGGAGDLLGFLFRSQNDYLLSITLISILRGILPGLLVRVTGDSRRIKNLLLQVAVPQLLCSVILMSLVTYQAFGIPLRDSIVTRFLVQLFTIPIYLGIIFMIITNWFSMDRLRKSKDRAERQRSAIAKLALHESLLNGEMPEALERMTEIVAEALAVDRVSIWELTKENSILKCLSLYDAREERHSSGELIETSLIPHYLEVLHRESRIYAANAQSDPRTSELREIYLSSLGIESLLDAGIMREGRLKGVVCLEHTRRREWHPDEEAFVSTVASLVGQLFTTIEQRQAEEELAQSHQRLLSILNSIDAYIFVVDFQTYEILFINTYTQRVWGHIVGETCWEVLQEGKSGPCSFCTNNKLVDSKGRPTGIFKNEYQNSKDGRWYESHDSAIHWIHGRMVRLEMATDITERKAMEEALKYQLDVERMISQISSIFITLPSERLDQGINFALEVIGELYEVDHTCLFQSLSKERVEMTHQWSNHNLQEESKLEGISVDEIPWLMKKLKSLETIIISSLSTIPREAEAEAKLLKSFSIESFLAVPMVAVNQVLGFIGFVSFTEEKTWTKEQVSTLKVVSEIISSALVRAKTERALQESEMRFRQMADNIEEVFWLISADTKRLLYVNRAYEATWGLSREDLYQDFVSAMLDSILEEDERAFKEGLEVLKKGEPLSIEYRIQRPDGSICWIYTRSFCVEGDGGKMVGHAGISIDITNLKSSQTEALQASRAKSEFLAIISHELRTPLHAIQGYTDLGIEEAREREDQRIVDFLQRIQISSKGLTHLINDLLDISRIEAGSLEYNFREMSMYELALNAQSELATLLTSKEMDLSVERPSSPVIVKVDRDRILQVLRNLIHNSIKFSPRGSSILVSFSLDISSLPTLITHVVDEGPGIPEEDLEEVFHRFKQSGRAMSKKKGTGLGLAICREIIKAHGGEISAVNEPERGARLSFTLPLVEELIS